MYIVYMNYRSIIKYYIVVSSMMKYIIAAIFLSSIFTLGMTFGIASAQVENEGNNTNDTTAAVANLTNASSSLGEAQNMSVIEGTMNATK
jgi:hypothetical protein